MDLDEMINQIIYHEIVPDVLPFVLLGFGSYAAVQILKKQWKRPVSTRKSELKTAQSDAAEGIILGRTPFKREVYSPINSEKHIAVIGTTGTGKTAAVGIPTLLSLKESEMGYWAIDISGDITKVLSENEHNFLSFRPLDSNNTVGYNVFSKIDRIDDPELKITELENLANYLVRIDPNDRGKADGNWYRESGQSILKACLIAYYWKGLDFCEIAERVKIMNTEELFIDIDRVGVPAASNHLSQFMGQFENSKNAGDMANCRQVVDAALSIFTKPMLKRCIGRPQTTGLESFGPEDIEEYNIIPVIPDKHLETFAPLVELMVNQLFNHLADRGEDYPNKILVMIDEFASFPNINILPALQKYRKQGVRIMLLYQSLADLEKNYGRITAQSIMDNIGITAVCGVTNEDTKAYFSKKAGTKHIEKATKDRYGRVASTSDYTEEALPATFFEKIVVTNEIVVFSGGQYTILKKAFYWQ